MEIKTSDLKIFQDADIPPPADSFRITGLASFPNIFISGCPGYSHPGQPERSLEMDIKAIRQAGICAVATLMTMEELSAMHVRGIGFFSRRAGMLWMLLDAAKDTPLVVRGRRGDGLRPQAQHLEKMVRKRKGVLLHSATSAGRAPTMAARMMISLGMQPRDAIAEVRQALPGAINTFQEHYLLNREWEFVVPPVNNPPPESQIRPEA